MSADERVLCVPSDHVDFELRDVTYPDRVLASLIAFGSYIPRSQCETDERFRQLLPYVVVRCGGLILAYQRKGTEKRLDGLWSIGIGGHVNEEDGGWQHGVIREIREELEGCDVLGWWMPGDDEPFLIRGPLGFLRDDSNPVGRVHLGVLYTLDVPDVNAVHMTECADYRWFDRIHAGGLNLENWSRMALEMLKGGA